MVFEDGEEERAHGERSEGQGGGETRQVKVQVTSKGIFLSQWSASADRVWEHRHTPIVAKM